MKTVDFYEVVVMTIWQFAKVGEMLWRMILPAEPGSWQLCEGCIASIMSVVLGCSFLIDLLV